MRLEAGSGDLACAEAGQGPGVLLAVDQRDAMRTTEGHKRAQGDLAGVGLAIVMVLAAGMHAVRGELPMVPINVLLGGLAVFVVWGRFKKAPIEPRR